MELQQRLHHTEHHALQVGGGSKACLLGSVMVWFCRSHSWVEAGSRVWMDGGTKGTGGAMLHCTCNKVCVHMYLTCLAACMRGVMHVSDIRLSSIGACLLPSATG